MTEQYIELQTAHVTQLTNSGVKGDWSVQKNITHEKIHAFPPNIDDGTMSSIMSFARKYELEAFNAGIRFQKGKQNEVLVAEIGQLKNTIKELADENIRLASILDKHIGE